MGGEAQEALRLFDLLRAGREPATPRADIMKLGVDEAVAWLEQVYPLASVAAKG